MTKKFKFIIHIGTEKTGTTTIQTFLRENREALIKDGFYYPRTPGLYALPHLIRFCRNAFGEDSIEPENERPLKENEWKRDFAASFCKEIKGIPKFVDTIILSSEHFHSRLKTENEIMNLRMLVMPFAKSFQISAYLRRQDLLAVSCFSTIVRFGHNPTHIIPTFDNNHYYDYENMLKMWNSVFPEARFIVKPFESEKLIGEDALEDFLANSMIQTSGGYNLPIRKNTSFSKTGVRVMMALNAALKHPETNRSEMLRQYVSDCLRNNYQGPQILPSRTEAENFYSNFKKMNQRIADTYLGGAYPFSEDFSRYPDIGDSIEPDKESTQILNQILLPYILDECQPAQKKKGFWSIFRR